MYSDVLGKQTLFTSKNFATSTINCMMMTNLIYYFSPAPFSEDGAAAGVADPPDHGGEGSG